MAEAVIVLDPDLVIAAGRHRYRVVAPPDLRTPGLWRCDICGVETRPDTTFTDCTGAPTT